MQVIRPTSMCRCSLHRLMLWMVSHWRRIVHISLTTMLSEPSCIWGKRSQLLQNWRKPRQVNWTRPTPSDSCDLQMSLAHGRGRLMSAGRSLQMLQLLLTVAAPECFLLDSCHRILASWKSQFVTWWVAFLLDQKCLLCTAHALLLIWHVCCYSWIDLNTLV